MDGRTCKQGPQKSTANDGCKSTSMNNSDNIMNKREVPDQPAHTGSVSVCLFKYGRKHSASGSTEEKKRKTSVAKTISQKTTSADVTKQKSVTNKNSTETKKLTEEADSLPLVKAGCMEKVASWLEGCVEPEDASSSQSSIEIWRGEDVTAAVKRKSIFPDDFYRYLGKPVTKETKVKKANFADEKKAFFERLQVKFQKSPMKKLSSHEPSTPTMDKQSEDIRQTKSVTPSSLTQSYTSDFFVTDSEIPTSAIQSYKSAHAVSKKQNMIEVPAKTPIKKFKPGKKSTLSADGHDPVDPLTSTKLFTTTLDGTEEAFPSVSTIGIDPGRIVDSRMLNVEKTPNKPTEFKAPKLPKKSVSRVKRMEPAEPRTSSRLFEAETLDIEQAFPTVSTIEIDYENIRFLSPEKNKGLIKTSTPLTQNPLGKNPQFDVDISSVIQDTSDDSIGLYIETTGHDINSEEIIHLSSTDSGPDQDDISSVIRDTSDDSIGFYIETTGHEINSEEIIQLSSTDSGPDQVDISSVIQDTSDDSSIGLYIETTGHEINFEEIIHFSCTDSVPDQALEKPDEMSHTLVAIGPPLDSSADKPFINRTFNGLNIHKVPICFLFTMKRSEKIPGKRHHRLNPFVSPLLKDIPKDVIPPDIL